MKFVQEKGFKRGKIMSFSEGRGCTMNSELDNYPGREIC